MPGIDSAHHVFRFERLWSEHQESQHAVRLQTARCRCARTRLNTTKSCMPRTLLHRGSPPLREAMQMCQPSSVRTRSGNGCAIRRDSPPLSSLTSRTAYASETASHIFSTTKLSLHPTWNHPATRNHPAQQTPREQKVENNEGQAPSTTTSRWPSRVFGTCSNVLGSLERRGGLRRLVGGKLLLRWWHSFNRVA